jgi:NADH-quinone oxidoreductase subunit E
MNKSQEDAMSAAQTTELADLAPAMCIVKEMSPVTSGDIIPLLQRIQESYGFLPPEVVLSVCEETGLSASRVFGVATFYSQFTMEPRGKHMVRCCKGTACHVRGGNRVLDTIEKTLGIRDGETTLDMRFTQETVACLGACALAPVMVMDKTYYGKMTARRTALLLKDLMKEES